MPGSWDAGPAAQWQSSPQSPRAPGEIPGWPQIASRGDSGTVEAPLALCKPHVCLVAPLYTYEGGPAGAGWPVAADRAGPEPRALLGHLPCWGYVRNWHGGRPHPVAGVGLGQRPCAASVSLPQPPSAPLGGQTLPPLPAQQPCPHPCKLPPAPAAPLGFSYQSKTHHVNHSEHAGQWH